MEQHRREMIMHEIEMNEDEILICDGNNILEDNFILYNFIRI
jgi:hypothetical protein